MKKLYSVLCLVSTTLLSDSNQTNQELFLVDSKKPLIVNSSPVITFQPYNDNRHHIEVNSQNPDNPCASFFGKKLKNCMECQPSAQFKEQLKKFNDEQLRHYFLQLSFDEYIHVLGKFNETEWQELKASRKNPQILRGSLNDNRVLMKLLLCSALGYGTVLSNIIGLRWALKWYGMDHQNADDLEKLKEEYYFAQGTNTVGKDTVEYVNTMYGLIKKSYWN